MTKWTMHWVDFAEVATANIQLYCGGAALLSLRGIAEAISKRPVPSPSKGDEACPEHSEGTKVRVNPLYKRGISKLLELAERRNVVFMCKQRGDAGKQRNQDNSISVESNLLNILGAMQRNTW